MVKAWQENQPELRALAQSVVRDPHRVEDILQEAYARILKAGREFASRADAARYLRTTVLNTAIDAYRRKRRRYRTFPKRCDPDPPGLTLGGDPLGRLVMKQERRERDELLRTVRAAVGQLPDPEREAVEFFFSLHDGPLKEVCKEKGVPYSTLRSRMLRGIDLLRRSLSEQGVEGFNYKEDLDELQ